MTESRKYSNNVILKVLVVDDEEDIRELLDLTLTKMGLTADCAGTVAEAKKFLENGHYSLCLTDMRLPDGEGLDVVKLINAHYGEMPVAVLTAFGSTDNAVAALKAGAFDYLSKPISLDQLRVLIKSAINLPKQEKLIEADSSDQGMEGQLVGESQIMQNVREMIVKFARSKAPIYISGESGTGKELAAKLIHCKSPRRNAPFVPVNCGAIPENLMESEFFGYRKGAFTGADADKQGFFHAANGGTLFLDEVAELPLTMQVKLLRAIQEKKIRTVGSASEEAVDVRIVSATHKKLKEAVDDGLFRQDLYYRLNVIELKIPSLKERREDIPLLTKIILERIGGENSVSLSKEAMRDLCSYTYPGNVRELENILERAVALCSGVTITSEDLQFATEEAALDGVGDNQSLDDYINRIEKDRILDALAKTNNNRTAAARLLGISFRSLRYRIERFGIDSQIS